MRPMMLAISKYTFSCSVRNGFRASISENVHHFFSE